jgi:hypothetical protein
MPNGIEKTNVKVTPASISAADASAKPNLDHTDPATIKMTEWDGREMEGILVVPQAARLCTKSGKRSKIRAKGDKER